MTEELDNLDSVTIEYLWKLYKEIDSNVRVSAKKYGLTVRDAKSYRAYAVNKATAMTCRIEGEINTALEYERICDRLYNQMTVKHDS